MRTSRFHIDWLDDDRAVMADDHIRVRNIGLAYDMACSMFRTRSGNSELACGFIVTLARDQRGEVFEFAQPAWDGFNP